MEIVANESLQKKSFSQFYQNPKDAFHKWDKQKFENLNILLQEWSKGFPKDISFSTFNVEKFLSDISLFLSNLGDFLEKIK